MKKLVVLTGAGMSAESGISTFRGGGGLWDKYPVEQVATPEGYAANPELVINFYNERRKQLLTVARAGRQFTHHPSAWRIDKGLLQPIAQQS